MFHNKKIYTLQLEMINGIMNYYLYFIDGQAQKQKVEISESIYCAFLEFEKQDKKEQNFFDRHIEHSELSDKNLQNCTNTFPKSVEEILCRREQINRFWQVIRELPNVQQRRLLLYFDSGFTYEQIAMIEGCTQMPVKRSIDRAIQTLKEKLKK
jgi:RNA polymerase sigma-70 factor (ECF subfamily)